MFILLWKCFTLILLNECFLCCQIYVDRAFAHDFENRNFEFRAILTVFRHTNHTCSLIPLAVAWVWVDGQAARAHVTTLLTTRCHNELDFVEINVFLDKKPML